MPCFMFCGMLRRLLISTPDVSEKCNALLYVLWDATASTDKYARRFGEM